MNKIIKFFRSLKFSFFLLILLFGVIVQRAIIAQRYFLSSDPDQIPFLVRWFDYFGLSSIELLNWSFWVVFFLLIVSLSFSVPRMIRTGKARKRGFERFKSVEAIRKLSNVCEIRTSVFESTKVLKFFRRKGYKVSQRTNPGVINIFAVKHDLGQWGVVVFHLTFFLLFLGGVASFLTRFTGYLELAPGESFVEKFDNYIQKTPKPFLFSADNEFSLTLEEINLSYWKPGEVKQRAAVLSIVDKNAISLGTKYISVNNPYKIANVKIYQGSRHGFIAGLTVTDQEGTTANGAVRFLLARKGVPELTSWAHLPGTTLDLKMELFSDKVRKIEGLEDYYSSSFEGSLMKVSSVEPGGDVTYHGVVVGGGNIVFQDLDLRFVSLKPFTSFIITRDYGVPIIFVGFVSLLLSLCIIYFWVPERYWITMHEKDKLCSIYVGGNTDKYKELFKDRFSKLMDEFEGVAGK